MKIAVALFCFFLLGTVLSSTQPVTSDDDKLDSSHVELGSVRWNRDFEKGKTLAASTGKPMFVLFQEIPGCQTCQNYGNRPLSHPLVVEAIEDLFVPVAIFNNKQGVDAQVLKKFDEPSWNNPVVRYLNSDETDIISRQDGVWTIDATVDRMIKALSAAGKSIPNYLQFASATHKKKTQVAEFAMHCFWEGEAKLGSIVGVHSTRAGWRNGLEVVQLEYSPEIVDYKKLLVTAQSFDCASKVFTHTQDQFATAQGLVGEKAVRVTGKVRDAKASDQKYYLLHSVYRHLPLTGLQATKINALVKQKRSADQILSPRQRKLLKSIQSATTADNNLLDGYVYPSDRSRLADYQEKLVALLQKAGVMR